jgi:hypothetical protein
LVSLEGIRELVRDPEKLQELTEKCDQIFTKPYNASANILKIARISKAMVSSGNPY